MKRALLALSFFVPLTASAGDFQLRSPAFASNGAIPSKYTCEGADVSPPLAWSGAPEKTLSFALVVDDPDAPDPAAPKRVWVHWVVYDLAANVRELAEGATELPSPAVQGMSDFKVSRWRGPCPPIGRHRYFFKLYALDVPSLPDDEKLTKAAVEASIKGHVLGQAELVGTYEKQKH